MSNPQGYDGGVPCRKVRDVVTRSRAEFFGRAIQFQSMNAPDKLLTVQSVTNFVVLCLAGVIGYGLITAPKVDFEKLVSSMVGLEEKILRLQERLRTTEILGDERFLRTPDSLVELINEYGGLAEESETVRLRLEETAKRLSELESRLGVGTLPSAEQTTNLQSAERELERFQLAYTTSVNLPPALSRKARAITGFGMLHWEFEQFADKMAELGLNPYKGAEDMPEEAREDLRRTFEFFLTNLWLLDSQDRIRTNSLVDNYTVDGRYLEFEIGAPENVISEALSDAPEGQTYTRIYSDLGVKRVFVLPYIDHPELLDYLVQGDNARDHLFRDIALLREKWLR